MPSFSGLLLPRDVSAFCGMPRAQRRARGEATLETFRGAANRRAILEVSGDGEARLGGTGRARVGEARAGCAGRATAGCATRVVSGGAETEGASRRFAKGAAASYYKRFPTKGSQIISR